MIKLSPWLHYENREAQEKLPKCLLNGRTAAVNAQDSRGHVSTPKLVTQLQRVRSLTGAPNLLQPQCLEPLLLREASAFLAFSSRFV